jgi:hypothetical protein
VRSRRFRTASRVFASLLLAWTTADLGGHALGLHQHGPIAAGRSAAPGHAASIRMPLVAPVDAGHSDSVDDCFYCSHCADVQVLFRIQVEPAFVTWIAAEYQSVPDWAPTPHYHPPLA